MNSIASLPQRPLLGNIGYDGTTEGLKISLADRFVNSLSVFGLPFPQDVKCSLVMWRTVTAAIPTQIPSVISIVL